MEKKKNVREDFLKAFTAGIIRNMISSGMIKTYPDMEKIKQEIKIYEKPESTLANAILMNQTPEIIKLMNPFGEIKNIMEEDNVSKVMKQEVKKIEPKKYAPSFMNNPINPQRFIRQNNMPMRPNMPRPVMRAISSNMTPSIKPIQNSVQQAQPAPPVQQITILGIGKIDDFLKDNNIQTVECPGPNKQVLVYKNGAIQATSLSLTADEIQNIMKDISDKARIPLMSGVFKAAYGNLIITAVMSEFVGTRFIINKKVSVINNQSTSMYK